MLTYLENTGAYQFPNSAFCCTTIYLEQLLIKSYYRFVLHVGLWSQTADMIGLMKLPLTIVLQDLALDEDVRLV